MARTPLSSASKGCVLTQLTAVFATVLMLAASPRIDNPSTFVNEVYRRLIAAESTDQSYTPPEDIYSARLRKLIRNDQQRAKGQVGCLDFVFWVNGQDWKITNLTITQADTPPDRKTVTAKFLNTGQPQEIRFDFVRNSGRWLLDDVHSTRDPRWTLSEILKCAP